MYSTKDGGEKVAGGVRLREFLRVVAHRRDAARVFEDRAHPVFEGGGVARLHGGAVFEQEVGVPLFLAGNRRHDDHRQADRKALRGRQAAGLCDRNVGAGHDPLDRAGEAHREQAAGVFRRKLVERAEKLFVLPCKGDDLELAGNLEEPLGERVDSPHSESARHHEKRQFLRIGADLGGADSPVARFGEDRHDRNPGCPRRGRRNTPVGELERHFVRGGEIPRHVFVQPHGVNVEIRDLDVRRPVPPAVLDLS